MFQIYCLTYTCTLFCTVSNSLNSLAYFVHKTRSWVCTVCCCSVSIVVLLLFSMLAWLRHVPKIVVSQYFWGDTVKHPVLINKTECKRVVSITISARICSWALWYWLTKPSVNFSAILAVSLKHAFHDQIPILSSTIFLASFLSTFNSTVSTGSLL